MIYIAVCLDENYVMPTTVMLNSLGINKGNELVTVFSISEKPLSEQSKVILKNTCHNYDMSITFLNYNISGKDKFQNLQTTRWSLAAYLKLYLADIIPISIDKVLFLDGDMIVRHSLCDLWNTDICDVAIAGCPDADEFNPLIEKTIFYDHKKYGYINTGVFLMNLNYHRKNNICAKYDNFIVENYSNIGYVDQDVVNNILFSAKKILNVKYNIHFANYIIKSRNYKTTSKKEKHEAYKDPVIVHFTGGFKPWHKWCCHPYSREWDRYQKLSYFYKYKKKNKVYGLKLLKTIIHYYIIKPFNQLRYL